METRPYSEIYLDILYIQIKNTGDKITSIGRGEIEGRALWGI
jgi:hypothetical protein